jgi:hypothetical protein
MSADKREAAANDVSHPVAPVREAHDAQDHEALGHDPTDEDALIDISNDESFPASDPPSHTAAVGRSPALSSGYDETAERALAEERAQAATGSSEDRLNETEASGGKKLGVMRYVLGISLVAIVIVFAALLLLYR